MLDRQRDIARASRVAVYGTLKAGLHNHHLLEGAKYLGPDRLSAITLYDLGPFPGALLMPSAGAYVEVYLIDAEQLNRLDYLEGYQPKSPSSGLYNRTIISTHYGGAWVYLYNDSACHHQIVSSGNWRPSLYRSESTKYSPRRSNNVSN
jgi:gamma-glutamylcyclotransferase (GGCT)/AIG2-like uncharacterized protein YtfP